MDEPQPGLWTSTARHPAWTPDDEWGPDVRSYASDLEGRLILFDPVTPPDDLLAGRDAAVVLTDWHGRSAWELDAPVHGN